MLRRLSFAFVAVAFAGCGLFSDSGTDDVSGLCEKLVQTVDARIDKCGSVSWQEVAGTASIHATKYSARIGNVPAFCAAFKAGLSAAVAAGTVSVDASAATACLNASLAPGKCGGTVDPGQVWAACPSAFKGKLQPGDACRSSIECAAGYCDLAAGCPGKCKAAGKNGDPCPDLVDSDCGDGLACDNGSCRTAAGKGASCEDAACLVAGEQAVCGGGTCGVIVPAAGPDAACGALVKDSLAACPYGTYCRLDGGTATGTCTAAAGQGSTCSGTTLCSPGLECVGGSCSAGAPEGGQCKSDGDCQLGAGCPGTGKCVTNFSIAVGGACSTSVSCGSSACQGGKCISMSTAGRDVFCGM